MIYMYDGNRVLIFGIFVLGLVNVALDRPLVVSGRGSVSSSDVGYLGGGINFFTDYSYFILWDPIQKLQIHSNLLQVIPLNYHATI